MTKQEIAQRQAELQLQKDRLEQEKKEVAAGYTEKIKKLDAQLTALAHQYLEEEENKSQPDMFDGIEEANIITEESRMLNSGLELPEFVEEDEPGDDSWYYPVKIDVLENLEETLKGFKCVAIKNIDDVISSGIEDWTEDDLANHVGKLLCHFPDNNSLVDFLSSLTGTFEYERQGNYLLLSRKLKGNKC